MRGGEMVATMSVMGAEGLDWPPQSYDRSRHTYVVSPPLAGR